MKRIVSSLLVVFALLAVVPVAEAQSQAEIEWLRQERDRLVRIRHEQESWRNEFAWRQRQTEMLAQRVGQLQQEVYGEGAYGGAYGMPQMFPGLGQVYQYPYDYSYGGMSYRGSLGRFGRDGFSVMAMPCRELTKRQRTEKFAAKVLTGIVGGAVLDRGNRKRGAVLGGLAGTAWGMIGDSEYCSPDQQIVLPVNPQIQSGVGVVAEAGRPVLPQPQSEKAPPSSGLSLRNDSEETAFVYDGDTAVTTLAPGASAPVSEPRDHYRAVVKRFNERGQVTFWELGRRAEGATLSFLPEGQRLSESSR